MVYYIYLAIGVLIAGLCVKYRSNGHSKFTLSMAALIMVAFWLPLFLYELVNGDADDSL